MINKTTATYLSSAEANNKVSDEGVLRLSRAVADHHTPAIALGQLAAKKAPKTQHVYCFELCQQVLLVLMCCKYSRLQGLCDRADLVDLQKQAVAGLLSDGLGDALWVRDSEIITHHLDAG